MEKNMMASKEQERQALEKIKKIVKDLGEASYIAQAFDGCFEMAENNIDDDIWDSMKAQRNYYRDEAERLEKKIQEIRESIQEIRESNRADNRLNIKITEDLKAKIKKLQNDNFRLQRRERDARRYVIINGKCKSFAEVRFINYEGFKFIKVVEKSGWTTSYKVEELTQLVIK